MAYNNSAPNAALKQTTTDTNDAALPPPANDPRFDESETHQELATAARFDDHRNPDFLPATPGAALRDPQSAPAPMASGNNPVATALRRELESAGLPEEAIQALTREAQVMIGPMSDAKGPTVSPEHSARYLLDEITKNGLTPSLAQNGLTEEAFDKLQASRAVSPDQDQPANTSPATAPDANNGQKLAGGRRRRKDPALRTSVALTPVALDPKAAPHAANNANHKIDNAPVARQGMALTA